MDTPLCISTLQSASEIGKPEVFNTDQSSQFTSNLFTAELLNRDIQVNIDGKERSFNILFIKRFWRTVKYEEAYLKEYQVVIRAY